MMTVDLGFGSDSQDAILSNTVFGNIVQQSLYGVPAPMAERVISQSIVPHVTDVMSAGPTGSATTNDATGSGTAIIGPFQSQIPVGYAPSRNQSALGAQAVLVNATQKPVDQAATIDAAWSDFDQRAASAGAVPEATISFDTLRDVSRNPAAWQKVLFGSQIASGRTSTIPVLGPQLLSIDSQNHSQVLSFASDGQNVGSLLIPTQSTVTHSALMAQRSASVAEASLPSDPAGWFCNTDGSLSSVMVISNMSEGGSASIWTYTVENGIAPNTTAQPPAGTVIIEDFKLVNDDGTSDSDNISTDPRFRGMATGNRAAGATIQLDYKGDSQVDATMVAGVDGKFEFQPTGITYGPQTVKARALNWDVDYATYLIGPWSTLVFELAKPPSPSVVDVKLKEDTGTSNTDRITSNPTVVGRVTKQNLSVPGVQVNFDLNNDDIVDDVTITDSNGNFEYRPIVVTPGTVTIRAKALYWDDILQSHVLSDPLTYSFTYTPPDIPLVDWLELAVDDGANSTDHITTTPIVVGQLRSDRPNNAVLLDFDTNYDGSVDGHAITDQYGAFVYTPVGLAVGAQTIRVRTKDWNVDTNSWIYSPWSTLSFTLVAKPTITLEVAALNLRRDTGASATDRVTSDTSVAGRVSGNLTLNNQVVDVDTNNDGQSDGMAVTNADGYFEYAINGLASGQYTVQARTRFWNYNTSSLQLSQWKSLSFTKAPDVNAAPTISTLQLYSDSGSSSSDNITENPLVVGQVSNPGQSNALKIEFDITGDSVADGVTYSDSTGRFFIKPSSLSFGTVTVSARATEFDFASSSNIVGPWKSLAFTYQDQPDAAPTLVNVNWQSATSNGGKATLTGRVIDDRSIQNVGIEIDTNGDSSADVVTTTDWFGEFAYVPFQPPTGSFTWKIRTKERAENGTYRTGQWQSYSFVNVALPSNQPPAIVNLQLINDDGSSNLDRVSSDLAFRGMVTNDGNNANLLVQIDTNGDGVADGSTLTNDDGSFEYHPNALTAGPHTIKVRAKEFTSQQGIVIGPWAELLVTLDTSSMTRVATLTLAQDSGQSSSDGATSIATINGTLLGDAIANVLVLYDQNGDGVFDGNATSNPQGQFTISPQNLNEGVVTIRTWIARDGSPDDPSSKSIRFIYSLTPDSVSTQTQVAELAAIDATWQVASTNFNAAVQAAATLANQQHNTATNNHDILVNTAVTAYQTIVGNSDVAYESAVAAADATYAAALSNAQNAFANNVGANSGITELPVFVWPASPPNMLSLADDKDQPLMPTVLGVDDGPQFDGAAAASQSGQSSAAASSFAAEVGNQRQAEGQAASTAEQTRRTAGTAAQQEYNDAEEAAQQAYADALKAGAPPRNLSNEAVLHENRVKAANDAYASVVETEEASCLAKRLAAPGLNEDNVLVANYNAARVAMIATGASSRQLGDLLTAYFIAKANQAYEANTINRDATHTRDTKIAAAQETLSKAIAESERILEEAKIEVTHWERNRKIQAAYVRDLAIENAKQVLATKNAHANYKASEFLIKSKYIIDAAIAAATALLQNALLNEETSNTNANANALGTPAAGLQATNANLTKQAKLAVIQQQLALDLLTAKKNHDASLEVALSVEKYATEAAKIAFQEAARDLKSLRDLKVAHNNSIKTQAKADNLSNATFGKENATAIKVKTTELANADLAADFKAIQGVATTSEIELVRELAYADVEGDYLAQELDSNGFANAYWQVNHDFMLASFPVDKVYYDSQATLQSKFKRQNADDLAKHDKEVNDHLFEYRERMVPAINAYDTAIGYSTSTASSEIAIEFAKVEDTVVNKVKEVALALAPEQKKLADLKSAVEKQLILDKANAKKNADNTTSQNLNTSATTFKLSQQSAWGDYQSDLTTAKADKLTEDADAEQKLISASANRMYSFATDLHGKQETLVTGEVNDITGNALVLIVGDKKYSVDSSDAIALYIDKVTDKTEDFAITVADEDRDKANKLSDIAADFTKSNALAEEKYKKRYQAASTVLSIATNEHDDGNSHANAYATFTLEWHAAELERREGEGEAIRIQIVDTAVAQKDYVSTTGGATTKWVSGIGEKENTLASSLKDFGITFTTTTSDSEATTNSSLASKVHGFNTGSASATESLNNELVGFSTTYNTAITKADNGSNTSTTSARGSFEAAVGVNQSQKLLASNAFPSHNPADPLFSLVSIAKPTHATANNTRATSYAAANTALTTELNTADVNLVTKLSSANKNVSNSLSDAMRKWTTSAGTDGAALTKAGYAADSKFDQSMTAVDVAFAVDVVQASTTYADDLETANVTKATAKGASEKKLYIANGAAGAKATYDAELAAAQVTYNASAKTARIKQANSIGEAEITAVTSAGTAHVTNVDDWNAAVATFTSGRTSAASTQSNDINTARTAWVSATINAQNADASALAQANLNYVDAIGQADVLDAQQSSEDDFQNSIAKSIAEVAYQIGIGAVALATNSALGMQSFLTALAPAHSAFLPAQTQLSANREVAEAQIRANLAKDKATADKVLIDAMAPVIAKYANDIAGQDNEISSDTVVRTNAFTLAVVTSNAAHSKDYATSTKTYNIDLAKAHKKFMVAVASLNSGDSEVPAKTDYDTDKSNAKRDHTIRKADADKKRALSQIDKAYDFATGMASDHRDYLKEVAKIEHQYVVGSAPLIAARNNAYAVAYAKQGNDTTTANNAHRLGQFSAGTNYRSADLDAQSTAIAGMAARAPSEFLDAQAHLADLRSHSYDGVMSAIEQNTVARNTAESTYSTAVNASNVTRASERNTAAVAFAIANSKAEMDYQKETADHWYTLVEETATAQKNYAITEANETYKLAVTKANADRNFEVDKDEVGHNDAIEHAESEYHTAMLQPGKDLETAKKAAEKKQTDADANSKKTKSDEEAKAQKDYDNANAKADKDHKGRIASADRTRTTTVAALERTASNLEAVAWSNTLSNPSNNTGDPWFILERDTAQAAAAHISLIDTAAGQHEQTLASAEETRDNALASAEQTYEDTVADIDEQQANTTANATLAFASQTGNEPPARTPPSNNDTLPINQAPVQVAGGDTNLNRGTGTPPTRDTNAKRRREWGETYVGFGLATVGAGFMGLGQGLLNGLNTITDTGASAGNLVITGSNGIADGIDYLGGTPKHQQIRIPPIPKGDWSRGALTEEIDVEHNISSLGVGGGIQILTGVGVAKIAEIPKLASLGQSLLAIDTLDNATNVAQGVVNAHKDGELNLSNGTPIILGLVGFGGNFANKIEIKVDPNTVSSGGLGGVEVLVRRGVARESAQRLAKQAEAAANAGTAKNGVPFGHGVSATTPEMNQILAKDPTDAVAAMRKAIEEAGFEIRHTPTKADDFHHTIQLPKPVTDVVADLFNGIFGRRKRD